MSDDLDTPYRQMIRDCEAAISRVRVAMRSGNLYVEQVGIDITFVLRAIEPRLIGYARRASSLGPEAFEETLDALNDCVLDDILSPTYPSLEGQFGAYLKTRPWRVLQQIARKYGRGSVSFPIARLDQPIGDTGLTLAETLADPNADGLLDTLAEREIVAEAVAALPSDEAFVIRLRVAEVDNNEIARRLGVSPATATRVYQRAVVRLRERLVAETTQ